jgi:hypothetical protein
VNVETRSQEWYTRFGNGPKSFLKLEISDGVLFKSANKRQKAPFDGIDPR